MAFPQRYPFWFLREHGYVSLCILSWSYPSPAEVVLGGSIVNYMGHTCDKTGLLVQTIWIYFQFQIEFDMWLQFETKNKIFCTKDPFCHEMAHMLRGRPDGMCTFNFEIFYMLSSNDQVAEVLSSDKTRLSISGWFYGEPFERPEPYMEPEPPMMAPLSVSLRLLLVAFPARVATSFLDTWHVLLFVSL